MALVDRLMMYKASQVYIYLYQPHRGISMYHMELYPCGFTGFVQTICGNLNIIVAISFIPLYQPPPSPLMSKYASKKSSKCHALKFIAGLINVITLNPLPPLKS